MSSGTHRLVAWLDLGLPWFPWVVAALLLQWGIAEIWPRQVHGAISDLAQARRLEQVVPEAATLRARIDSLVADTAFLEARWRESGKRILRESDPGAALAAQLVPELANRGWKLQRVRAEAKAGWAVLDLGAEADFGQILLGMDDLRKSARALRVRRVAIRPLPHGKLAVDLQVASPTEVSP
ncbi:MAG TPA: hypothetical protein PKO15_09490 [Fibrobacteria bacterium]|nr:hypothetical protein [Fibrobacteria bacterium]HOX50623.1 hypothetical protein [Fibrobacteria bacterium]